MANSGKPQQDAVIVGAGFAGLYMLYRTRQLGLQARVFEAADDVGGTWYWNRYPGARCDAESLAYSFSFDAELEQDWQWSERYASQPEILRYVQHVADRFELRSDIQFNTRVSSTHYDEATNLWHVTTDKCETISCRYVIMATGCLSVPSAPDIEGLDSFQGELYTTGRWPHHEVDFSGKRVGVIGTGSSGVQAIPVIAELAKALTVFQRTPSFSVPAANAPLDEDWVGTFKAHYPEHRHNMKYALTHGFGDLKPEPNETVPDAETLAELSDATLNAVLEERWRSGGSVFLVCSADVLADETANERVATFIRRKIKSAVTDPKTAQMLCPDSYPVGTKRICVDTDYYATYNRDNVHLVNIRENPIRRISEQGIQLNDNFVELDMLVLATGFDAMTGALLAMDIRGRSGQALADKWAEGPRNYLGLMTAGFPNLFTITGPGSPSVLTNVLVSIEQHVDMIADCLSRMLQNRETQVEADADAENQWGAHVNDVANETLFPKAGSWYMGANIPGKPRVFMPYAAGAGEYRLVCEDVIKDGWRGFNFA